MPKTEEIPPSIFEDSSAEAREMKPVLREMLEQVQGKNYFTKLTELPAYQAVRAQDMAYQGRMVLALAAAIARVADVEVDYRVHWDLAEILSALIRTKMSLTEVDYLRVFAYAGFDFTTPGVEVPLHFYPFPVVGILNQVAKLAKKQELGAPMKTFLAQLRDHTAGNSGDVLKVHLKTQEILGQSDADDALPVVVFADGDPLGLALSEFVQSLDPADPATGPWLQLLQLWQRATAGQPTAPSCARSSMPPRLPWVLRPCASRAAFGWSC